MTHPALADPETQRAPRIAVLVPCHNESMTVASVITGFSAALPGCTIWIGDNNSTDDTAAIARSHGARVVSETNQGKGNVVRRLFAEVHADIYVLVDGDATYDAASAPALIAALTERRLDMVTGRRISTHASNYRAGHQLGNRVLTGCVSVIFGNRISDMLSGYRVFSRRFVKSFPALSAGFEIETELTVHALEQRLPIAEFDTPYFSRPDGSTSKLRSYRDGWRILRTIILLVKEERPLAFFGTACAILVVLATILAIPIFITFAQTGLVPRLPTALLAVGCVLLGSLSLVCGLILQTVTQGRRELKRLHYLACGMGRD